MPNMGATNFHPPEEMQKKKFPAGKKKMKKKAATRKVGAEKINKSSVPNSGPEMSPPSSNNRNRDAKGKSVPMTGRIRKKSTKRNQTPDSKINKEEDTRETKEDAPNALGSDEVDKPAELERQLAGDTESSTGIPSLMSKAVKPKKKKAHSSSTDTSDEEYKAMVKAGLIVKPKKKQSSEPQELKPKTEEELLEYFLSRHTAADFLPQKAKFGRQQKTVEAKPVAEPLSKRGMFRQYFESKTKQTEGEVRDLKPSDFFPLAIQENPPERPKGKDKKPGKTGKRKAKKKTKTMSSTGTKKVTSKSTVKPASKTSKGKLRKVLRARLREMDEQAQQLHDVTISPPKPTKAGPAKPKGKKRRRRGKQLGKKKEKQLPNPLLEIVQNLGEFEISTDADHDVGSGREETQETMAKSETAKRTLKRRERSNKKVVQSRIARVKLAGYKRPTPFLKSRNTCKPSKRSPNEFLNPSYSKIWIEVSGPNLRVQEFGEEMTARLSTAPPGTNLSLMQLFTSDEMRASWRKVEELPASVQRRPETAVGKYGQQPVARLDFLVLPLDVPHPQVKRASPTRDPNSRKEARDRSGSDKREERHYLGTSKPKTAQKPGSATRVSTGNQQVPLPPPSPQTDHQGNNKKKLRIKRKQKRSTSPEKEYKDAALEAETQMKNLDASVSSIKPIEDTTDKEIDQPGKTGGSRGKHVTFQGSFDMDEYLLEQAARGERGNAAKNQADEDFDYDTLRELQARLKEGIRIILTKGASGDMHMEIEALRKELARRKGGDPPDTLGIPRVYDKSLVRYELPMDIAKLEGLTPLQYLEEYSFVSDSLKNLHARVYKRHRDLQPSGKFSFRALTVAMSEIMGQDWSPDDSETICKIIGATVRKAGHGDAKGESILAAVPGSDTGPSPGTASEISKGSSRSQHSALKEPAKTLSSRQSTSTSVGHESHPSPPGSPTFATSTPRLIDLLNAGRDRRMRERRLAEHAKRTEVPDIGALRSAGKPAEGHALSTLDLNQFQVVAAFAERAFCLKYAEISHNVVRCKEYVEIADFERLQEKLSYVDVSEELKNLLTLIKNT